MTDYAGQPKLPSYLTFDVTDLKVTDPAVSPTDPVVSLKPNRPFKIVMTLKANGAWWDTFRVLPTWKENFSAEGEGATPPADNFTIPEPVTIIPDPDQAAHPGVHTVELYVSAGIPQIGLYDFGGTIRLPKLGINGHAGGHYIDILD
jgi:hypothetical protein